MTCAAANANGSAVCADGQAHRWKIEPPGKETSEGRCRYCGVTRMFRNGFEEKAAPYRRYVKATAPKYLMVAD